MRRNPALAKLNAGGMTSGISVGFDSPDLAELAAHSGFDYVWLEWQHGQFSEHTLNNAIARFLPVDTAPIVRVKSHEPGAINHVLDMGAMGVIVPMVETAAEARAIAHVTYYPPLGRRSTGGTRLSLLGDDYTERANDEMLLVVMVETESAINNVTEIMAVPGVDVVLIGPGDLMLGRSGAGQGRRLSRAAGAASPHRLAADRRRRRLCLPQPRSRRRAGRARLPVRQLRLRLRRAPGRLPVHPRPSSRTW